MTRTCLALQHLSFEDLGTLGDVLAEQGWRIQLRQAGVDDLASAQAQAEWSGADLVVVLGGPTALAGGVRLAGLVAESARSDGRPMPEVRLSGTGASSVLAGARSLVVEQIRSRLEDRIPTQ